MNTNDIWLIAGLGNPEAKYDGTRHNAGFAALDYLSGKWGISVSKTKFQGLWGQGEVDGHKVVLLKPLTYMNLSGDSIAPLAGFFKIPADHVIVLCDDITQNPGKLRIRPSGSAGGHNGLKSIIARLGGDGFPRIRIGVGAKPRPDYDLADWVLGKFPAEDASGGPLPGHRSCRQAHHGRQAGAGTEQVQRVRTSFKLPSACALGIFSGILFLLFVFVAACGPLQTHFHRVGQHWRTAFMFFDAF